MRYFLPALASLIFLSEKLNSQDLYFFTSYSVQEGLSNQEVNCITSDKDGFVWVGTQSGLNRFNGYSFEVYKSLSSDSATIPSNVIHSLTTDHRGRVWVSTFQGACVYNKRKNNFIRIPVLNQAGVRDYTVETFMLYEDTRKNLWAGCNGMGLLRYDEKQNAFVQAMPESEGAVSVFINSIAEDADGTLWLTSYGEIMHYDDIRKTVTEYKCIIGGAGGKSFQAIKVLPDSHDRNTLWIGTWGNGMARFDKSTGLISCYKFNEDGSPNLDNIIFNMLTVRKNELWLATNNGILPFDTESNTFGGVIRDSINEKTVVNTAVRFIYSDDDGIRWIGTARGLCNIHPYKQKFIQFSLWRKAPANRYYHDEKTGKIYGIRYYSNRILAIYNESEKKHDVYPIPQADELRAEPFSVIKDNRGLIWIGTSKGIYSFDESTKKFTLFDAQKSLNISDRSLFAGIAFKDSKGNIWFGCYGRGILKINPMDEKPEAWFTEGSKNKFPCPGITGIGEDKNGRIITCDQTRGIAVLNPDDGSIEILSAAEKKFAQIQFANDLCIDKAGNIWVATKNSGLVCIDQSRNLIAYTKDGLGNLVTEQRNIIQDNDGMLWITTENGLYRFDPLSKSFTHFSSSEGFPARSIDESLALLNDGSIAYNYAGGIFRFYPAQMKVADKPLPVHLNSFSVNGKYTSFSHYADALDTVFLQHFENNVTVEFAAINFTNPDATLYSHMLDGVDRNWSAPSHSHTLNYSQLPPGNYTLKIKAGEHSPEKRIFISIIPAWWQTLWFKWSLLIAAVIALAFIIRFLISLRYRQQIAKLEQQREIENIRVRISRDIHDEIGAGLTKIKLMSRHLAKAANHKNIPGATAQKISSASDELIQSLGEIVWTVNPANDSLENIVAYLRNYLSGLFDENKDVMLSLDFPEPHNIPRSIIVNPDIKRNLLLITKESATNILKHSSATEATISLYTDDKHIDLHVSDNGKGFAGSSSNGSGNGLKNMQKRSEAMNAVLRIESAPQGGTNIHLSVPLHSQNDSPL